MLAIVPARGGSKDLPKKNILLLCGKPLIVYTIEEARKSKFIDRIILSTDDLEIAKIAKEYGIEVPFMRPEQLALDNALAIDNYIYSIERINSEENNQIEEFVVLQPTSPLRTGVDIDNAIQIFKEKNADSVISLIESLHPPFWSKKISKEGKITEYYDIKIENKNRQDFEKAYMPNGAIFVLKYSLLKEKYSYYSENTYPYIMPRERSIDIDDLLDFKFAEFLMRKNNERF